METIDLNIDAEDLNTVIIGDVLLPESENFEQEATVWNAGVVQRPQLIVLPETTQDVVKTVQFARQHGLPLSVRGGGHDWAGRAIVENGVLINMRRMNQVQVDADTKTAIVGGGALGIEVGRAVDPHKLVAATPTVGDVGFTGWTLGGGYGPISPSVGLGIDNVIGAVLVLADGTVATADEQENPELFWAIRGGGGNFGVVTSLRIQLHEAKPLIAGMIAFNGADAQQVFSQYNQLMATAPNELAVSSAMMHTPDGQLVVALMPFWFGEQQRGERYIETMKQFATPVQVQVGPMTYPEMLDMQSSFIPKGFHWAIQTRWLPTLEPEQIQTISDAVHQSPSPYSFVNLHHFHGKSTTISDTATPFPLRKPHYMVEIIASWQPEGLHSQANHQHPQWASKVSEALKKGAYPGGYANLLGPDEAEQINHAYGDNLGRLQRAKRTYDPDGVFNSLAIPGYTR